jgi:hypothetical protein
MEIKFIDESLVPKKGRAGSTVRNIDPFLAELVKHPNKWAVYPDPVKETEVSYLRRKFPKYDLTYTTKTQTLFVKYTQDETDLA